MAAYSENTSDLPTPLMTKGRDVQYIIDTLKLRNKNLPTNVQ